MEYLVGVNLGILLLGILIANLQLSHRDLLGLDLRTKEAKLSFQLIGALKIGNEAPL